MANTFNNASVKLSTTATTDIYQAPTATSATSIVLSCLVANVNGSSPSNITITKTDSSNTEQTKITYIIPVGAATTLEIIPNKLVLKAGEKIRATSSVANYLDVTLSALEITV